MTRPDSSARPIRSSVGPLRPTAYSTHGGSRSSAAPPTAHSVGHDGLGNRKTKIDAVSGLHTTYSYDVELNPADPNHWDPNFATKNNRLVSYEVRSGSATGTLLRTVEYTYYKTGDASNISVKDEYVNSTVTPGDPCDYGWWYDLALYPYTNGTVAIIANGKFKMDNGEPNLSTYQRTAAREYAYDDPRARWLARELDPCSLAPTTVQSWTDYLGVMPWSDFDVELNGSQPVASEERRYLATAAEQDSAGTRYLHGDLIDSTVMTTSGSGSPVGTLAYTAFGEPIGDANSVQTRYRYAGGWGYASGFVTLAGPNPNLAPLTLQHIGSRWYQPDVGRFVQRDSVGLDAGLNVYVYCFNSPLVLIDPTGNDSVIDWIARNYWLRLYSVDQLASVLPHK